MFRAVKDAIASVNQRRQDREKERLRAFYAEVTWSLYDPARQAERDARLRRWDALISQ